MKTFRVKLEYAEIFKFTIQAETAEGAEKIALQLMSDTDPQSSEYYWNDSEIWEIDADESEIDN